jgi:superfamily II DNA or RNA helicase
MSEIKIKHKDLTRNGYIIDINTLSKDTITDLKKDLTVTPIVHPDFSQDIESYQVFRQDDNMLYIPKYYGIEKFGVPKREHDLTGKKSKMQFQGKLRASQLIIAHKCLTELTQKGGGIISLPCGGGKTVLGIYLACQLGLKTLVVVHKTFLQDQWLERIKQFSDAKVGIIRQKKIDVERKDIVVGMLQSISMIDYDPTIFEDFGCVIYDEVHHNASRVFSNALLKLGARYTIGLSATPHRSDGLTKVLHWYIGDIIHKEERKSDNKVIIKVMEYKSSDKVLFAEKRRFISGSVRPDVQKMLSNLIKIKERNLFINEILLKLLTKKNRKIIVLSGRIDHLKDLKKRLDTCINDLVATQVIDENEYTTAYYIGKSNALDLKDAAKADVIFGSYAMAEEGLDIDGLNTLVFATPKKNIIQSLGRIMRKPVQDGDVWPVVIDIADSYSCFKRWGDDRINYYEKQDYVVNVYSILNKRIITVKEYLEQNKVTVPKDKSIAEVYITHRYGAYYYELLTENGKIKNQDYNHTDSLDNILGDIEQED